jgi:hypothetical protein
MDEATRVLDRLDRIETLHRDGAPPVVLLGELQELLGEAEAWARAEGARMDGVDNAVSGVRKALERGEKADEGRRRTLVA